MQQILSRENTVFEGKGWCAVVHTPKDASPRIAAMLPTHQQAVEFKSWKSNPERYRVVPASLTAAGAWSVDL